MDENIKGTLKIDMYSDGDFGFNNLRELEENGWVVWHDEDSYDYTFKLENFVGDKIDLKDKVNDIFEQIRTSRIYIMKDICEVFEKIQYACVEDELPPELYLDYGNQTYKIYFDFKPCDERDSILKEIKDYEYRIDYWEGQINDYQKYIDNCNNEIAELKSKLEKL